MRSHGREVKGGVREYILSSFGIKDAVKLDVFGVLGLGLIHSDRVVCQMHFSAKIRRLKFIYLQIQWQSFSVGII